MRRVEGVAEGLFVEALGDLARCRRAPVICGLEAEPLA